MEYGVPELLLSDLGINFVSAANLFRNFLNDRDNLAYYKENDAKFISFEQFYKGNSEPWSLVESTVKVT